MSCFITCECGSLVRAESLDAIVAAMRRHLAVRHPEIAGAPLEDDLIAMAVEEDD